MTYTTTQEIGLTEAQKTELDNRLETFQQNPKSGSTWEQVKQRLQNTDCDVFISLFKTGV